MHYLFSVFATQRSATVAFVYSVVIRELSYDILPFSVSTTAEQQCWLAPEVVQLDQQDLNEDNRRIVACRC